MQTCVVHVVRAGMRSVNYKNRKKVAAALKPERVLVIPTKRYDRALVTWLAETEGSAVGFG